MEPTKFRTADQVEVEWWGLDHGRLLAHRSMVLHRIGPRTFSASCPLEAFVVAPGTFSEFAITIQGVIWSGGRIGLIGSGCPVEFAHLEAKGGDVILMRSVSVDEFDFDGVHTTKRFAFGRWRQSFREFAQGFRTYRASTFGLVVALFLVLLALLWLLVKA